jgi:motility quorum-sensing regulator/GCU-specific mRNA interferase toxin
MVNYELMEKRTPHYQLNVIQEIVARNGIVAFTRTARLNAYKMGLTDADMLAVVCLLRRDNFYKSMTSFADHTLWQDVYHAITPIGRVAYIKISRPDEGRPVIQFKEK